MNLEDLDGDDAQARDAGPFTSLARISTVERPNDPALLTNCAKLFAGGSRAANTREAYRFDFRHYEE
ncbi:hypothetical protein VQ02_05060 [Methylobacterium variabile]|uniref:Uncharacterized protein n=1 Tax=Methylobacterium variabile TaxID=298794 RepID=A0A0J6T6F9_9HYPH|nr:MULTISPECIES: hypothetical protein [Methylobacterium]KMO41554.1 hypothetical protein VQ02_05060 [Methylobacterium variabile]NGM37308.1 hypothetical protein [Methylobacterium sp. DB0501]UHC20339.1 hypothetical protein LRS73_34415 [Methylobacterium currus]